MWPFRRRQHDPLLDNQDLEPLAPSSEAERYLLVYPVAVGLNYVMIVVYEAAGGERVHVAHSPGSGLRGGGLYNFVEWIGTGIRRRDPDAAALLTSWPPDEERSPLVNEVVRIHFRERTRGTAPVGRTILVDDHGDVANVLTREQECLYQYPVFGPRTSADEWSRLLGVEVPRFTTTEWDAAANVIDPDRSVRDAAERESDYQHQAYKAFLDDMGVG